MGSPGETLSRRCVALLKTALRPDVWPGECWLGEDLGDKERVGMGEEEFDDNEYKWTLRQGGKTKYELLLWGHLWIFARYFECKPFKG